MKKLHDPANDRRKTQPFELPIDVPLHEVSIGMLLYCSRIAEGMSAAGIMQARSAAEDGVRLDRIIDALEREGDLAAVVYWLIRDLEPYEAEFRHFLNTVAAKAAVAASPSSSEAA